MAISTDAELSYLCEPCSGIVIRPFAGGTACVYTHKEPGKESCNEDASALIPCDDNSGVLVIADGLGGQPGGQTASSMVIAKLSRRIAEGCESGTSLRESILDGIEHSNASILNTGAGSATTVMAVEISAHSIRTFHVGDSMALVTGQRGKIKHQTIPHSPVGYAVESGMLDEDDAMHHDERHLISNVVGSAEMRLEIGPPLQLAPHDTLVLGSDGLFDNISIDEIIASIRCGSLETCAKRLSETSLERMINNSSNALSKPDDITFMLYRPR